MPFVSVSILLTEPMKCIKYMYWTQIRAVPFPSELTDRGRRHVTEGACGGVHNLALVPPSPGAAGVRLEG